MDTNIHFNFNNIRIDKVVAEYDIWDNNVPYAKYKVKVYEDIDGKFTAYTNLQVIDIDGTPYGGVGHGDSIDMALKDAIIYFSEMYKNRDLTEKDYCYMDSIDF